MRAAIVIPSNRATSIKMFFAVWADQFLRQTVIVVEDGPSKTFDVPEWVQHVSWAEIDKDLGKDAWIIPRRTDCIRNYGFLLAARAKPDMIVTLDDDCMPLGGGFLDRHWSALETPGHAYGTYDTIDRPDIRPRGYPKEIPEARTVLNHGLWNGVPDLDGETQLRVGTMDLTFEKHSVQVPRGTLFPMCGMNIAFRPEILPAMYFPPMGEGQPYNRFGDIWCGVIAKRVCDVMGYSVRSGTPFVRHERASDPVKNAALEASGIPENDRVWRVVNGASAEIDDVHWVVSDLYRSLATLPDDYWMMAHKANIIWRGILRANP